MCFQVYALAGYGGLVPHGPNTVGASIFHQTNGFRCPAPTPPRPHQSSLTTPPAFVNVLLLCNFTSKLKIARRLGQTLFGVRKQQSSYQKCLMMPDYLRGGKSFLLGIDNEGDVVDPPLLVVLSCFGHTES